MGEPRVAVVAGLRTPFAKRGTELSDLTALDLGRIVCAELLDRVAIDPAEVEEVVYGQVIPSLDSPNIAREIVLGIDLPEETEAYSVSQACITSYRSTVCLLQAIRDGAVSCGISGGADSASSTPIAVSESLREALHGASSAKNLRQRLRSFQSLRPGDLVPRAPVLAEPSTGETMGEAAERMAKENAIPREDQDAFAHRSHQLAARAWEEGKFAEEVLPVPIPPRYEKVLERDNLVRTDSRLERYAELPPVFDRDHGSVTAANSSPLTDGASALLVASEEKARALDLAPLGFIRSYAFTALDPKGQLLMGPVEAAAKALDRAGLALSDMDLVDMHEAFGAQVLSVLDAFASPDYARKKLGREEPLGEVDREKLNVNGGSIALGHPFAATGARQILQTLHELRRRRAGLALVTACAAGGMGAAIVLEAA